MTKVEFKINDFITLKLEKDITHIYVAGKEFRQCKYLAFQINLKRVKEYDKIDSIDDMEQEDRANEYYKLDIAPEEEFWGHCSNMQAWAENEYDTRLLHSNLSFPLLRELAYKGDTTAKKVFKEEIVLRILSNNINTIQFLILEGYLSYFTLEEINVLSESFDLSIIHNLSPDIKFQILRLLQKPQEIISFYSFREEIINSFKDENIQEIQYLIEKGFMYYLSHEQVIHVLDNFDFDLILELPPELSLFLLESLSAVYKNVIPIIKDEIKKRFQPGDISFINILQSQDFLRYFTKDEINEILSHFTINQILNLPLQHALMTFHQLFEITNNEMFLSHLKMAIKIALLTQSPETINKIISFGSISYLNDQEKLDFDLICKTQKLCIKDMLSSLNFIYMKDFVHLWAIFSEYDESHELYEIYRILLLQEQRNSFEISSKDYKNFLSYLEMPDNITPFELKVTALIKSGKFSCLTEDQIRNIPKLYSIDLLVLRLCTFSIVFHALAHLQSIKYLDLSSNYFSSFPKPLFNLKNLLRLNMSNNRISEIPDKIISFEKLENFNLDHNNIKSLPHYFFNLSSLGYLSILDNAITSLPSSIDNLVKLKSLNLSHNRLKNLPITIGNITSLEYLNLDANHLDHLPRSMKDLKNLKTLYVNDNFLLNIPDWIGDLTSLEILSMFLNGITSIPKSFERLINLKILDLRGNRLPIEKVYQRSNPEDPSIPWLLKKDGLL